MNRLTLTLTGVALAVLGTAAQAADIYTPGEPARGDFKNFAQGFIESHCLDCHDKETAKGNLSLEELGPVDETNAAVWKSIWAQVTLQEMPPKKKSQPDIIERLRFSDWIVSQLQQEMKGKGGFSAHLDPNKGNFVAHDLLFGPLPKGIRLVPTASPARIWRVTPQEHITRLNELINTEPAFDPAKPGLRTRGDMVPINHGGELKLYFGTDRIIRWEGGTVAYATAVKSVPVVLSSKRKHGLENYPDFYTVNSSESTLILDKAEDILRYMAYGPMSLVGFPEQITDDPKSYDKIKPKGDIRGTPIAIVYNTKIVRLLTPIHDLMKEEGVTDERLSAVVNFIFEAATFRPPTADESTDYLQIVKNSIAKVGKDDGVFMGLSAIFLDRDALFRSELAATGKPDVHGRVMLQDWELGLALNHALSYIQPDAQLRKAITEGRMRTRDDVRREVIRMLEDDSIRKPRVLRFFRDFFDYDLGGYICKDTAALGQTGVGNRGNSHYSAMFDGAASTDRLIELILEKDKDVLKEMLTTQQFVATNNDRNYFGRKNSPEERAAAIATQKIADEVQGKEEAAEVDALEKEVAELEAKVKADPRNKDVKKSFVQKNKAFTAAKKRVAAAKKRRRGTGNVNVQQADLSGSKIYARVSRRTFGRTNRPDRTLAVAPEGQRLGLLTHPSWLVSHSDAMDNHAILRGRWIRERLLGGGIPDVPITVDAMLPDEPKNTLRERMRVTREAYCWTCHEKMDPLGLPFEMYNHAGLFRVTELNKSVDTTGAIIDSGDPDLDGPVKNAIEMIDRLAKSDRVEQVFVRHAFRFWMGRNETINDGPVLQDAYRAYRENGSMKALLNSLLTSDAFLYRKVER